MACFFVRSRIGCRKVGAGDNVNGRRKDPPKDASDDDEAASNEKKPANFGEGRNLADDIHRLRVQCRQPAKQES